MDWNEQQRLEQLRDILQGGNDVALPELEEWIRIVTPLVIGIDTRVGNLEQGRRQEDFDKQQEAARDEAIARRDLAQLQLETWQALLSLPRRVLGWLVTPIVKTGDTTRVRW